MSNSGHKKRFHRYHAPGHLHELTFSCFSTSPLLTNTDYCGIFARQIDIAFTRWGFSLHAFVFMPATDGNEHDEALPMLSLVPAEFLDGLPPS